jgi:hypothetical protein
MRGYIDRRRSDPRDDLISALIAAEEDGARLTTDEMITTCILLLNAGHEATVHTLRQRGEAGAGDRRHGPGRTPRVSWRRCCATTRRCICSPAGPTRTWRSHGHTVPARRRGGAAAGLRRAGRNRLCRGRPLRADRADGPANLAFGAGLHFCVGAPLARLEMQIALPILFERCPGLALADTPRYADIYHFHGLEALRVRR